MITINLIVLVVLILITIAIFQKFALVSMIKYQFFPTRIKRVIPGTREHRLGEYDVQEPEPLPSVDEIVGYLWTINHDRNFIDRFLERP